MCCLTGFDVPSLHTIYVDKAMRDHGLFGRTQRLISVHNITEIDPEQRRLALADPRPISE